MGPEGDGQPDVVIDALVAALRAVETWRARHGLDHPAFAELEDHLWDWPLVTGETFMAWHDRHPRLLETGLGGDLLPDVADHARERGVDPDTVAAMCRSLSELVHSHVFAAVDVDQLRQDLAELRTAIAPVPITLEQIGVAGGGHRPEHDGWGPTLTAAERDHLRFGS